MQKVLKKLLNKELSLYKRLILFGAIVALFIVSLVLLFGDNQDGFYYNEGGIVYKISQKEASELLDRNPLLTGLLKLFDDKFLLIEITSQEHYFDLMTTSNDRVVFLKYWDMRIKNILIEKKREIYGKIFFDAKMNKFDDNLNEYLTLHNNLPNIIGTLIVNQINNDITQGIITS